MATEAVQTPVAAATGTAQALDPVYMRVRDVVYKACGIYHADDKMYLLGAACTRRMSQRGVKTSREYLDYLTTRSDRDAEVRAILNEVTIGETYLFRSVPQLEALKRMILPQFMEQKAKMGMKKIRIWSAGCSTGEEPYTNTLAMVLLEETLTQLKGWTFDIAATDLNDRSVETAKAGIYGNYTTRNIPELFKKKYMHPGTGDKLVVNDDVKARISFSRLNLSDDSKMLFMKGMDVIFCCNVLIYFDLPSKSRVVQHFYSNLMTGGYFFLGHAESLYQVNEQFRLVHFPSATAYWKKPPDTALGGGR
jgi:chemotaxis protein methyltransferase CheR